jgi:hypothetical protein
MMHQIDVEHLQWLKLMQEGQFTRDSSLRTRGEIEQDRREAKRVEALRNRLFPENARNNHH